MARTEIDLNPIDFITIGTLGPQGKRVFHLQAGREGRTVAFVIEKEQAWALGEAIREFIDDLDERYDEDNSDLDNMDMDLREPIQPLFRVAQMGLAFDEDEGLIILIAQEAVTQEAERDEDDESFEYDDSDAGIVRMWCTRQQMRALSNHAMDTVQNGRPNPKMNGRITYYWT